MSQLLDEQVGLLCELFADWVSAGNLIDRIIACWFVRQQLHAIVLGQLDDRPSEWSRTLGEVDRTFDKLLAALLRTDPEGFEVLEEAVLLAGTPQRIQALLSCH
jgi:hypothetical protein